MSKSAGPGAPAGATARQADALALSPGIADALRAVIPGAAEQTVAAVMAEVPSYAGALSGAMGANIQNAVELALGGFVNLASRPEGSDPHTPLAPVLEGAYALGRGEARSGRSMDALLSAYRVGARVSWRELSRSVVTSGLPADTVAQFAELVFAYIDELSAASAAGHADELATSGRVRQRYLERLAQLLLTDAGEVALRAAAERADWDTPTTLTVVVLPEAQVHAVLATVPASTLQVSDEIPDPETGADLAVLFVPDLTLRQRGLLVQTLQQRSAVVGPPRPWLATSASYARARQTLRLGIRAGEGSIDTEEHLAELVLRADPAALDDLRARVLAPLSSLRSSATDKLTDTLRAFVLHHGRRDQMAAALFVHPQTVRYRMGQLRELYGDSLDDPDTVLGLTLALGTQSSTHR